MYLTGNYQKDSVIGDRIRHKIDLVKPPAFFQYEYVIKIVAMKILDTLFAERYLTQVANSKVRGYLRGRTR